MWLNPAQTATLQLMFDTLMQSLSMVFEICWKWRGHSMKIKGWTSLKCSQSSWNSFLSHAKSKLMGWILVNVHPLVLNRYGLILLNMLPCCWCSYSHSSLTSESWTRLTGLDLIRELHDWSINRLNSVSEHAAILEKLDFEKSDFKETRLEETRL